MDRTFSLGQMLSLTGTTKNQFDGAKNGEVLPTELMQRYDFEDGRSRAKFSLRDGVVWKCFSDLTRLGQNSAKVSDWIFNSTSYIANGVSKEVEGSGGVRVMIVPDRDFMTWTGEDLFICREAYTADYVAEFKDNDVGFSVRCWAGTEAEIASQIAFQNAADASAHRETLALQLYNLSKAVRFVKRATGTDGA